MVTELDALTTYFKNENGKPLEFNRPIQKHVGNVIFGIVFGILIHNGVLYVLLC